MTLKTTALAAAALLLAVAPGAQAQTRAAAAPAAAAPTPLKQGPAIAGVCVFSSERAIGTSAAGKAMGQRLEQLLATVKAELAPQQTSLQADAKTFDTQRTTLPADQQQARAQSLQARYTTLQQLEAQRQRELQATAGKAQQRIGQAMEPIVRSVYESRGCSMLLNGDNAVMAANPAMDLTDAVRTQLDARLPTITFDREHLDQQPAAGR